MHICAVLHCQLWLVWLYHMFPHYLINETFSGKINFSKIKYVFWFHLQHFFFWKITPSKKNSTKCYHKYTVRRSLCKVFIVLLRFLTEREFSRKIFEKSSNIKLHKNPSSLSRAGRSRQNEGQTDMTNLTAPFHNFANRPNNRGSLI